MGFAAALRRGGDGTVECTANPVALVGYAETKIRGFSDTPACYRISGSVLCTHPYWHYAGDLPDRSRGLLDRQAPQLRSEEVSDDADAG